MTIPLVGDGGASVNSKYLLIKAVSMSVEYDCGEIITASDYDAYVLDIEFMDIDSIEGTCNLHFVRGDGQTLDTSGTIDGNHVRHILHSGLYTMPNLTCYVQFLNENLYTPLKIVFSNIRVYPTGETITTLDPYPEWIALLEQLNDAVTLIDAKAIEVSTAVTNANTAITNANSATQDAITATANANNAADDANAHIADLNSHPDIRSSVGTIANLTTTAKTSAVAAINELDGEIGNLTALETDVKTNLVSALNELANSGDGITKSVTEPVAPVDQQLWLDTGADTYQETKFADISGRIGDTTALTTTDKSSVVNAINEVDTNINVVQSTLDIQSGSFLPVVTGATTNPTVTYAIQRGRYYKIGKLVKFSFFLRFTASGGSGLVEISTPFPFAQNDEYGNVGRMVITGVTTAQSLYNSGATVQKVRLLKHSSVSLDVSEINSGSSCDITGSITYETT